MADARFSGLPDLKMPEPVSYTHLDVYKRQLTFTAYAVQYEGFEDNPAAAWAQITSANTTTTTP